MGGKGDGVGGVIGVVRPVAQRILREVQEGYFIQSIILFFVARARGTAEIGSTKFATSVLS